MSEPTKEQIEKAPLHEKTKTLMHDLAGARSRIDELHEKIAHLEKRLTGALQALRLSERRRDGVPLSGEVNENEDFDVLLVRRLPGNVYRELECLCGSGAFTISLADNGQWNLECGNCHETAAILTKVLAELR